MRKFSLFKTLLRLEEDLWKYDFLNCLEGTDRYLGMHEYLYIVVLLEFVTWLTFPFFRQDKDIEDETQKCCLQYKNYSLYYILLSRLSIARSSKFKDLFRSKLQISQVTLARMCFDISSDKNAYQFFSFNLDIILFLCGARNGVSARV